VRSGPPSGRAVDRPSRLHHPPVVVEPGGEVDDELGAVVGDDLDGGRDRARGVHDQDVPGLEEPGEERERAGDE